MQSEKEQLRAYFDAAQPSEEFRERLLAQEASDKAQKTPARMKKTAWALPLAAAACAALALLVWQTDGLRLHRPLQNESPPLTETEAADEPNATANGNSAEPTADDPAPSTAEPTQTPPSGVETEPPTEPTDPAPPAQPTEHPTEKPTQAPTEPTTQPPVPPEIPSGLPSVPPVPPDLTQQTEPPDDSIDAQQEDGWDPEPQEETEFYEGWYEKAGDREYILIHAVLTDKLARFDVTGKLHTGQYGMMVTAFNVRLMVTVTQKQADDGHTYYTVDVTPF